jgi:hypothetical protein
MTFKMSQTTDSTPELPKPELYLPTGDQKDYVQKELDQIQSIISRMGANSFQCKGWAIGIVTIALAINKDSFLLSGLQSLILLLPIFVFWYLDGFFLYTEKCYRDLSNDVIKKRFYKLEGTEHSDFSELFNFNYTRYEHKSVRNKSFWLTHVPVFIKNRWARRNHIEDDDRNKIPPSKITTIASVMVSKTLIPFYLLPIAFVCFAALKSKILPEIKEAKEPISIQLDSTTLQLLLKNAQTPLNIHVTMEKEKTQPELPSVQNNSPKKQN